MAATLPIKSGVALVIDADTGQVLYEKGKGDVRSIASITKLMTAIVTMEANLPMDEIITISKDEVDATMLRKRPTSGSLPVGVSMTRGEVLHLTLMNSQNRAAAALARTYPGGAVAFVRAMNDKALELGMKDTRFVDPTGLFNENVSTANDLAILVNVATQYPDIRAFSTDKSHVLTWPKVKNGQFVRLTRSGFGTTNRLVTRSDWDIRVQKTGYIRRAGHCVVMMTVVADRRVVIVLLDAISNRVRARDAVSIKYWLENDEVPSKLVINSLDPYKSTGRSKLR